jgi:hypothetical protein
MKSGWILPILLDVPHAANHNFGMVAGSVTTLIAAGLSKSTVSVVERAAKRRRMTVDAYVKKLVAEDAEMERTARTRTFAELAMPFQQALANLSENDLDALARPGRRRSTEKKKR